MNGLRLSAMLMMAILLTGINTPDALGIDVVETQWGFDGRVVTSEFNPLSVLITNPSSGPFDGVVSLHRTFGGGSRTGARLVETVYLANSSQRWVQFYPYCTTDGNSWTIRWRDEAGSHSYPVPPPRNGNEEPVLLDEANSFSTAGRGVKHFSEELFPPGVTGTQSLKVMVIDRVPRWEAPRRQAFMDWLRLGGMVHLLHTSDGEFPRFTAELSELNSPMNLQRVGAGVVFRHEMARENLDGATVKELASTRKRFVDSLAGGSDRLEMKSDTNKPKTWSDAYGMYDTDNELFSVLKQLTNPNHNWALIYLLSFVYIGLIFPGCFLLGRRRVHFLVTYGAIIGCVALFSTIFLIVGRRGYGEQTKINFVAIAQHIEGEQWSVDQFSNVFATTGGTYEVAHQGEGAVYSTCSTREAVNGDIDNGVEGKFTVDIPPFSSRPFAHRMKIKLPQVPVTKVAFEATDRLQKLELQVGPEFPADPVTMFAQYRHGFYKVRRTKDRLNVLTSRFSGEAFMQLEQYGSLFGGNMGGFIEDSKVAEEEFRTMWRGLLARHLGIADGRKVQPYSLPIDRARLYVFAEAPDEFRVTNESFPAQSGLVLYAIDILRNETNAN